MKGKGRENYSKKVDVKLLHREAKQTETKEVIMSESAPVEQL